MYISSELKKMSIGGSALFYFFRDVGANCKTPSVATITLLLGITYMIGFHLISSAISKTGIGVILKDFG
jgi:hypothetical protein